MDLATELAPQPEGSFWRGALRCPECSGPLVDRWDGLLCERDGAYFATTSGVRRLLGAERREEIASRLAFYTRVRADEGWERLPSLPRVPRGHPHEAIWRRRARHFEDLLSWLDRYCVASQRIADIGAGCCWASERLAERGHRLVALDVNLCERDGLLALGGDDAQRRGIERIEADMEFLPLDAGVADIALLNGTLHYSRCAQNVLAEARRILTQRGVLMIMDTPVFRRSQDGEAMIRERKRHFIERYQYAPERDQFSGYFTLSEIRKLLLRAGFKTTIVGWPGRLRESARDLIEMARHGRRTARFPLIIAQRGSAE